MKEELSEQSRDFLIDLLVILKRDIQLAHEDMFLITMQINTERKLIQFENWIRTKVENGQFRTTPEEVLNKTAQIGRVTAFKKKIPMSEFEQMQREHPEVDLLRIYTPISDEEFKLAIEDEKGFKVPEFLKQEHKS